MLVGDFHSIDQLHILNCRTARCPCLLVWLSSLSLSLFVLRRIVLSNYYLFFFFFSFAILNHEPEVFEQLWVFDDKVEDRHGERVFDVQL